MKTVSKKSVKKMNLKSIVSMLEKVTSSLNEFAKTEKSVSAKKIAKRIIAKTVSPKTASTKRICAISKSNRKRYFKTLTECSKALSIDQGNMSKAIHGIRKSAGGYRFEYVD